MKLIYVLSLLVNLYVVLGDSNILCYYDSSSYLRRGLAKLLPNDLELSLQFCTHLVYGYAGITPKTLEIKSLNVDLDMFHYNQITLLKGRFPQLKVFLSVGGDRDKDEANPLKYVGLLESELTFQQNFIDSSVALLKRNGFDGLDLAFQLPRNKPRKVHSGVGLYWKKFKKLFTGDFIVDEKADEHKNQYTKMVQNLRNALAREKLSLSMTVLPNVNSTWYFDVAKIHPFFDFINLAAFDFVTPERNPEEADFSSPIYMPSIEETNRQPFNNIDFQVKYWLDNGCPSQKLNLGIATYGRAWKLTKESNIVGLPVVPATDGPADAALQSNTPGLLSWPEICALLPNGKNQQYRGERAPIHKVVDIEERFGNYGFRPADDNGEYGIWVSFNDPQFAGVKTNYVKSRNLGGVALFDLSYDDFRGLCTGQKYPILRSIKYYL